MYEKTLKSWSISSWSVDSWKSVRSFFLSLASVLASAISIFPGCKYCKFFFSFKFHQCGAKSPNLVRIFYLLFQVPYVFGKLCTVIVGIFEIAIMTISCFKNVTCWSYVCFYIMFWSYYSILLLFQLMIVFILFIHCRILCNCFDLTFFQLCFWNAYLKNLGFFANVGLNGLAKRGMKCIVFLLRLRFGSVSIVQVVLEVGSM